MSDKKIKKLKERELYHFIIHNLFYDSSSGATERWRDAKTASEYFFEESLSTDPSAEHRLAQAVVLSARELWKMVEDGTLPRDFAVALPRPKISAEGGNITVTFELSPGKSS